MEDHIAKPDIYTRITRPLRHNGIAYCGLNIIWLWAAPTWMTYRQAIEFVPMSASVPRSWGAKLLQI